MGKLIYLEDKKLGGWTFQPNPSAFNFFPFKCDMDLQAASNPGTTQRPGNGKSGQLRSQPVCSSQVSAVLLCSISNI